jgi:hypothetical protein
MEASGNAVGFADMYDDLSEATHYGGTAFAFPFQTDQALAEAGLAPRLGRRTTSVT